MPSVFERYRGWLAGILGQRPQDRRRLRRDPLHASVVIIASGGFTFHASARDCNAGGVGAIVCADLQVGDEVVVKMDERKLRCAVRNRNGYRYGFEFVGDPSPQGVWESSSNVPQPKAMPGSAEPEALSPGA